MWAPSTTINDTVDGDLARVGENGRGGSCWDGRRCGREGKSEKQEEHGDGSRWVVIILRLGCEVANYVQT